MEHTHLDNRRQLTMEQKNTQATQKILPRGTLAMNIKVSLYFLAQYCLSGVPKKFF